MPVIPALGKLRQVCYELVSSLGYRKKKNQGSTHKGIYLQVCQREPSPKSCPLMSPCTPWLPSPSCIQTQNKGKPRKNKNDLEKSQERLFRFCRSSHLTFHDLYTVNTKYRKGCGSLTDCLHGGGPGFSHQHLKIKTRKTLKMRT